MAFWFSIPPACAVRRGYTPAMTYADIGEAQLWVEDSGGFGPPLLLAIPMGLIAYGLYLILAARYLRLIAAWRYTA